MFTKYHNYTIYNSDGSIKAIESDTYEITIPFFRKLKKALSDLSFGISVLLDDDVTDDEDTSNG